ncbi:MAG: LytTR family DNA-binding domain-containing protein [Bacteroidota bacterium]
MIHWLIEQLKAPFPEPEGPQATLRIAVLSGLFVALFLILFQPFGLATSSFPNKYLILAGFGAITFVALLFNEWVLRPLLPLSGPQLIFGRWLIWTSWLILSIAIGNFLYVSVIFNFQGATLEVFLRFCFYTLTIGIFPCFVTGWINKNREARHHLAEAENLQQQIKETQPAIRTIRIQAQESKSLFEVPLNELLFLESQDNYVLVHYLVDGQPQKEMIRSTLRFQEISLKEAVLIRCHRSFMVNLSQIGHVTGNAQGLKLHLRTHPVQIPVSRKYIAAVRKAMEALG